MKKRVLGVLLTMVMATSLFVGCGNKGTEEVGKETSNNSNVLEFYHGYFHEESE